jgi:hypothetical protein
MRSIYGRSVPMKRLAIRLGLLVVLSILFTFSAAADYPTCQDCWVINDGGAMVMTCDDPMDESWGYEECTIVVRSGRAYCRRSGGMCYYFDVEG